MKLKKLVKQLRKADKEYGAQSNRNRGIRRKIREIKKEERIKCG